MIEAKFGPFAELAPGQVNARRLLGRGVPAELIHASGAEPAAKLQALGVDGVGSLRSRFAADFVYEHYFPNGYGF